MNRLTLTASLLALAVFSSPMTGAASAASSNQDSFVIAQAEQGSKRIENIKKFLQAGRNLSRLPDDRLQQRLERAKAFQGTANLPSDLMAELQKEEQEINAELARRQQAGGSSNAGAAQQQNQQAQKQANTNQQQAQNQVGAGSSGAIESFLASAKPADSLDDRALRQQMRQATQLAQTQGISNADRQKLRQIMRDGRAELAKREQAGGAAGNSQQTQAGNSNAGNSGASGQNAASSNAEVSKFLAGAKPAGQLETRDLRQQVQQATRLAQTEGLSRDDRQKLRQIVRDGRAEIAKRGDGTAQNQQQGGSSSGQQTQGGGNAPNSQSEQQAKAFLGGPDAKSMSDADLRKRLGSMRDLLASDQLTPATKKALRERLASDRTILRSRVNQGSATNQNTTINGNGNTVNNTNVTVNNNTVINQEVVRVVRNDRRPSKDLNDRELRQRINVWAHISNDKAYSDRERVEWRGFLERDRRVLRDRMLTQRDRRRDQLRVGVNTGNVNIQLGLNFRPDRPPPPRYVFAAEANDAELEDILAAPPRRAINRRYTVEEVETSPDLRDAVARIEIDTVRFGFGEGFLREEEVENLDRIAEIMEKILATHPNEVFMIEGHTDAVGSDAANLQLSRERARAVKEALVTFFVIPPENLKTVGFGEKYLKIPTQDAEAENRRVSVARITPLVGELAR